MGMYAGIMDRGSKVAEEASRTSTVLKHSRDVGDKNKDVTTLEWNRDGTLLATGEKHVVRGALCRRHGSSPVDFLASRLKPSSGEILTPVLYFASIAMCHG